MSDEAQDIGSPPRCAAQWKETPALDEAGRDFLRREEDIRNPPRGCLLAVAVACGLWALAILWMLL